ncbi:MAG: cytochrome c3 family protein [Betaproteobacteria bacterium]|nr:cytochrome c3 family protein [Betaproteobacteria bacterium]
MYSKMQKVTRRFGILALAAVLALVAGWSLAATQTKPDAVDTELIKKATTDVATQTHLAGIHVNKLKLNCQACHRDNPIPDDTASKVNASCVMCHGGYDKMAEVSKKKSKNPDINVHASHLGPEIGCTTCHQGHQESKAYCLYCHTSFDLPIPGGADTKADKAASKK